MFFSINSDMLYSSQVETGTPRRVPRNPPKAYGVVRVISDSNSTSHLPLSRSIHNCEEEAAEEDEMHEDTEELNALLFSDGEYDEDEETSTGHSPSTVIDNRFQEPVEETWEEEVNSFSRGPTTKRRRTQHWTTDLGEGDAESVYVGSDKRKRFRREKIHETLRALRGLIPDVEGKEAVVVIDEAVNYLRSLKLKAKALGLDGL